MPIDPVTLGAATAGVGAGLAATGIAADSLAGKFQQFQDYQAVKNESKGQRHDILRALKDMGQNFNPMLLQPIINWRDTYIRRKIKEYEKDPKRLRKEPHLARFLDVLKNESDRRKGLPVISMIPGAPVQANLGQRPAALPPGVSEAPPAPGQSPAQKAYQQSQANGGQGGGGPLPGLHQASRYGPDVTKLLEQIGPQAFDQMKQQGFGSFDPLEQQARYGFQTKTLPSIAERFTDTFGGKGSSGFRNALGEAGSQFELGLNAQRAGYNQQRQTNLTNLLGTGLTPPYENVYQQPGPTIGQGLTQLGSSLFPAGMKLWGAGS